MSVVTRLAVLGLVALLSRSLYAQQPDVSVSLRKLDATVFTPLAAKDRQLGKMVEQDIRSRVHAAHRRLAEEFAGLKTREEWEKFRDERIKALRDSLGPLPEPGKDLKLRVVSTYKGQDYERDNLVFESRSGISVTANLYRPAKPPEKMPGIVIVHGFHQPKHQGELQDMGVNWAKLGCLVLVPDVLGHGERRQHPFVPLTLPSPPGGEGGVRGGKFNPVRQDYSFRANVGLQLFLTGESLMGWMAFDVIRGVDLLLGRPGIDKDKIIVLGAVASGGDIAAVAAALDPRIAAVAPFNFGGPEPETVYPLPAQDPELAFPYGAGGHWDSSRRLRNSLRDGFLPWVIVGATAPRRLIYAHEFAWDRDRDPVFPRLERIFALEKAGDRLAWVHGSGTLFGKPEGTGCANIGAVHRKFMYPPFTRWFDMLAPVKEVQDRKPDKDLLCLTPEIVKELKPQPVQEYARAAAYSRWLDAHRLLVAQKLPERKEILRRDWARLMGDVEPKGEPKVSFSKSEKLGDVTLERIALEVEPGIVVPLVLLMSGKTDKRPVVIGVAQHGKQEFLRHRADGIAELLKSGVAVCLPDVRGTGETMCDGDRRGPPAGFYKTVLATSNGTLLANEDLMLGRTLLGDRLRDLRNVLRYLKGRNDLDSTRLALWGESFAPVNGDKVPVEVPWDAEKLPAQSEPLGGLLALFGALYEDGVVAVSINGGLTSYANLTHSQFCHVPHDVIVPGALTAGDLGDVTAALAPRPVRVENLVDGRNRRASQADVVKGLEPAYRVYLKEGLKDRLVVDGKDSVAAWLVGVLKK
jgi:dienelactone hydrolase